MIYQFQSTPIAIRLAGAPVAIMHLLTVGRGSLLPRGATWLDESGGWWQREATDEVIFAQVMRAFPEALGYHRISSKDIPQDRTYRNALQHDGQALSFDMDKAREIHLDMARAERAPLFEALDKDWMKAMGQKDQAAADTAEEQRQKLRDLTDTLAPALAAAKTVQDLKQVPTTLAEVQAAQLK